MSMQWKCKTCGEWVSMDRPKHIHHVEAAPTLAAVIAAREAGIDATDISLHEERWTPDRKSVV